MDFQVRKNAVNLIHLRIGSMYLGRVFLSFYYCIFQIWIKYVLLNAIIKIERENVYKGQENISFSPSPLVETCAVWRNTGKLHIISPRQRNGRLPWVTLGWAWENEAPGGPWGGPGLWVPLHSLAPTFWVFVCCFPLSLPDSLVPVVWGGGKFLCSFMRFSKFSFFGSGTLFQCGPCILKAHLKK